MPKGRWQGVSLLAYLFVTGLGPGLQIARSIDRQVFDQVVVCDTLSVHTSARAQAAIEAARSDLRFLPPSCPDFNSIELAFSKLKHLLRRAEARTTEEVMEATADAYPEITASDAVSYDRHAG